MQDRGSSLIGRTLKLTFAINASCLAKERCIPEIDNSEKIYAFLENIFETGRRICLNYVQEEKHYFGGL
jgi:hypothetical protein